MPDGRRGAPGQCRNQSFERTWQGAEIGRVVEHAARGVLIHVDPASLEAAVVRGIGHRIAGQLVLQAECARHGLVGVALVIGRSGAEVEQRCP